MLVHNQLTSSYISDVQSVDIDDIKMGKRQKKKKENHDSPSQMHIYMFVLISLTVINIVVFYGFNRSSENIDKCSSDTIIQFIAMFISNNSEISLREYMPKECSRHKENTETELSDSIRGLVKKCRNMRTEHKSVQSKLPVVTLFTTYAGHHHEDNEKFTVHNNTFVNWSRLKPKVKLILFANKTYMKETQIANDWEIMSSSADDSSDDKPPVLKEMFSIAMRQFDTPWYGYVNADILFTDGFIKTLEAIANVFNVETTRILVTGRRTNINNVTLSDAESSHRLHHRSIGVTKYREDAEDYFITTRPFPWQQIIPVVVGRPGYDNWLVSAARCDYNTTVIDVSDTVLAVHQTTQKGGNHEGYTHKDSNFNFDVIKKYNITPNFIAGLTSCATYRSYKTFCDTTNFVKRDKLGPACVCKKSKRP